MSYEINEKNKKVAELKVEIERLEADKGRLMDWYNKKGEELKVIASKESELRESMIKSINDADSKKKQVESEIGELKGREAKIIEDEKKIKEKIEQLERQSKEIRDLRGILEIKDKALDNREFGIKKKETILAEIFAKIEALK